ncbi:hypothetical protein PIIN_09928 [Serendipita indica DSM 11827]|uniref:Uncharacterized protein n=1 Tax=Serendipita indica (strain DSM 11827) TaxID=1109443 RepID=G4TX89_SERID|nr:hypothetical protein PIIN_09928 [Serendipita indica DSM 11827]
MDLRLVTSQLLQVLQPTVVAAPAMRTAIVNVDTDLPQEAFFRKILSRFSQPSAGAAMALLSTNSRQRVVRPLAKGGCCPHPGSSHGPSPACESTRKP